MATKHIGSGQDFTSFKSAIDNSPPGTTFIVHAGTYTEQVRVGKANMKFVANSGDSPKIDGGAQAGNNQNGGLPSGFNNGLSSPYTGRKASREGLLDVSAAGCEWDGIDIMNGQGVGVRLVAGADNFKIKNCEITGHRIQSINPSGTPSNYIKNVWIENCEITLCGMWHPTVNRDQGGFFHNWPVAIAPKGVDGMVVKGCHIHSNWGGGIIFDGNRNKTRNVRIIENTIGNNFVTGVYAHACENAVIEKNVIYNLNSNPYTKPGGKNAAFGVGPNENSKFGSIDCVNIKIVNNIAVNCGVGFWSRNTSGDGPQGAVKGIVFANNTLINTVTPLTTNCKTIQNSIIANNIWTSSDNKATGGNPQLWTFRNNFWSIAPATGYRGTGDKVGDAKIVNGTLVPTNNYTVRAEAIAAAQLQATSTAKNAGANLSSKLTVSPYPASLEDAEGRAITSWNIGGIEHVGNPTTDTTPTASFTMKESGVDTTEAEIGQTVVFNNTSVPYSGQSLTDRIWLISKVGETLGVEAIKKVNSFEWIFSKLGKYKVELTVTQSDGQQDTAVSYLDVVEDRGTGGSGPPVQDGCNFTEWKSAVRSGSPTFGYSEWTQSYWLRCLTANDKGAYTAIWAGEIDDTLTHTFNISVKSVFSEGYPTVRILCYNSSSQLIESLLVNLPANAGDPNVEDDFTLVTDNTLDIPTGTKAIRVDIRVFNAIGTIAWKNPCLSSNAADPPPYANLSATVNGQAASSGAQVLIGDVIGLDGSASNGTGTLTYLWELRDENNAVLDSWQGSTLEYVVTQVGNFSFALIVTQPDNQKSMRGFHFEAVQSSSEKQVWFTKYYAGNNQVAPAKIIGPEPQAVRFVAHQNVTGNATDVHKWKIRDGSGESVLVAYQQRDEITISFPLPGFEAMTYSMELVVKTTTGDWHNYVEYACVEITESSTDDPPIGPSRPNTISLITGNVINDDGSHTHQLDLTGLQDWLSLSQVERQNTAYLVNDETIPDMTQEEITQLAEKEGELPSVLNLNARFVVADRLPKYDPEIAGALYIDSATGTVKISAGVIASQDPGQSGNEGDWSRPISIGNDDGEEVTANGAVNLDDGMLRLTSTYSCIALRFQNVLVPKGSTITSAILKLYHHDSGSNFVTDIYCEDVDNAPALAETAYLLTNKTRTTAKTSFSQYGVGLGWQFWTLNTAMIKEVTDRASWASGNSMTLLLDWVSGADIAFRAYDGDINLCAILDLEFTTPV